MARVREVCADGIGFAGDRAQVHAEEWVGVHPIGVERRHDGGGHHGGIPVFGLKLGAGEGLAFFLNLGGRLNIPAGGKRHAGRGRLSREQGGGRADQ